MPCPYPGIPKSPDKTSGVRKLACAFLSRAGRAQIGCGPAAPGNAAASRRTRAPASAHDPGGGSPLLVDAQTRSQPSLRRGEAGWGATAGERAVGRMTNPIRLGVVGEPASEWRSLDRQGEWGGRRAAESLLSLCRRPAVLKAAWESGGGGAPGGWGRNVREESVGEAGRPARRGEPGRSQSPRRSGEAG